MHALQDRVEGAALLEAAELRGDESDAELDSDADSDDLELGSEIELESDAEVDSDAEAESDADESPLDEAESDAGESDDAGPDAAADSDDATGSASELDGKDAVETEQHSGLEQAQPAAIDALALDSAEADSRGDAGSGAESASGADVSDDGNTAHTSDQSRSNDGASEAEESDHSAPKQNKPKLPPAADSLQTLKKKLAAAKQVQGVPQGAEEGSVPIEWGRVLTAEDFERIKELRHRSDLTRLNLQLYMLHGISAYLAAICRASFALQFGCV